MAAESRSLKSSLLLLLVLLGLTGLLTGTIALEPPTGNLEGKVVDESTKAPLPNALVSIVIAKEDQYFRKRLRSDIDGQFRFAGIPAGSYRVAVHGKGYYSDTRYDVLVPPDGQRTMKPVSLQPRPPEIFLWASGITDERERPHATLNGYIKEEKLRLALYPCSLLQLLYKGTDPRQQDLPVPQEKPLSEQEVSTGPTDIDGGFNRQVSLPITQPGAYLVVAQSGKIKAKTLLMISDIALIAKQSSRKLLVYAANLKTGKPVSGAEIEVRARDRRVVAGKTGASGLFDMALPRSSAHDDSEETESRPYVVISRHGSSVSYVFSSFWGSEQPSRCYLYTDRPIYRPSQQVFFKGILRAEQGGFYKVMADREVQVTVRDASDSQIYAKTLRTNRFGTFHDSLTLSEEPGLGSYRIIARTGKNEYYGYFEVAEYRKPEYKVTVAPSKTSAIVGETVQARVEASYYFGPPVPNAKIAYNIYKSYYYSYESDDAEPWAEYYEEDYSDYGYGEVVLQGEAMTDAQGIAILNIPTHKEDVNPEDSQQKYTVEVEVTDASMKSAKGAASFIVASGAFGIDISSDYIVARPNEKVTLRLRARRFDDRPQPGARIALQIGQWDWNEEEEPEGRWRSRITERGEVVTDAAGKASFPFTPSKAGYYRIRAESLDEQGNPVQTSFYLWVAGEDEDFSDYRGGSLEVVADKKVYGRGDTAKVLITTTEKGSHALVTVEGEDLHRYEVIPIAGNSKLITVPIEDRFIPNVFVSVCLISRKEFYQREIRLNVAPKRRFLNVTIKPDKAIYRPGEKATYRIITADTRGRSVSAEVSLGVVDESVYALREEVARDIRKFFWGPRPNMVNTNYSFPDFYPGGADKFGFGGRVRKYFPDTAFWTANLVTDQRGQARVTFQVPDSLTTWRATARAVTFDTRVGQQVQKVIATQELLVRLQTPRFFTQKDQLMVSALVHNYTRREQQVKVRLAVQGIALTDPPDRSLTVPSQGIERLNWHVKAEEAGDAKLTVYAQGENAADAMELTVPVLPHGIERYETRAGSVEGELSVPMDLPQEAIPRTVRLTVRLTPTFASAMLGALDYLAAYPYGCMEQTMSAFVPDVVASQVMKDLNLPMGERMRELPRMVTKGLQKIYALQHEDGGWGWCESDATSPYMTAWAIDGLMQARQAGFAVDRDRVNQGVRALRRMLQEAYRATPAKPNDPEYLSRFGPDTRAYMVYALAEAGAAVPRQLERVFRERATMNSYTRALLSLAYLRIGNSSKARQVLEEMKSKAIATDTECHWESKSWHYSWTDDDLEGTAFVLKALARGMPEDPLIPKTIRWLLLQRTGSHWISTKQSAAVVYAFSEVLRQTVLTSPPEYTARLTVNGKPVGEMTVNPENAFTAEQSFELGEGLLQKGQNQIRIVKEGEGPLMYSADLRYVSQEENIQPSGERFAIRRTYYRLVPRLDAKQSVTYVPEEVQGDVLSGDLIQVKLTLRAEEPLRYLIAEDYLPGGCEPMAQTEAEATREEVQEERSETAPKERRLWGRRETRDERVSFLCEFIPKGTSTVTYRLRAVLPGHFAVLPAQGYGMYHPEVRANSAGSDFQIR